VARVPALKRALAASFSVLGALALLVLLNMG
jgi:hypothetical protein